MILMPLGLPRSGFGIGVLVVGVGGFCRLKSFKNSHNYCMILMHLGLPRSGFGNGVLVVRVGGFCRLVSYTFV